MKTVMTAVAALVLLGTAGLPAQPPKGTPAPKTETAKTPYFSDPLKKLDPEHWAVSLPEKHPDLKLTAGVDIADGLRLMNRPHVTSRAGFPDGGEFAFEWMWKWDADETPTYEDHFQILVRTTGKYKEAWNHEPWDGLRFKIMPVAGQIELDLIKEGKPKRLKTTKYEVNVGGSPAIPAEKWFELRVVDTGTRIQLHWDREITAKHRLLVDEPYDAKELPGDRFGWTNREPTADIPKVSGVKNFVSKRYVPPKK